MALLVCAVLFAVAAGRLVIREPGTIELVDRLLGLGRAGLYGLAASFVAFGLGRPLTEWSALFSDPVLAASAAIGLGLGFAGLASLAAGCAGALALPFALALAAAGAALAWPHRAALAHAVRALVAGADGWALACAALLLVPVALVSCPPVYGDEVTYHASLPADWVRAGAIPLGGPSRYLSYPLLVQALSCPGLILGVPEAARVNQLLFTLLTVGVLVAWARPLCARPWVAPLVHLASPLVLLFAGIAYVSAAKAFYQLLALAAFLALVRAPTLRGAVVLGLTLTCYLWTKQVALGFCAFLTLCWLIGRPLPRRVLFVALAVAGLAHLPHLVNNYTQTGDPLFPYGGGVFHARGWNGFLMLNSLMADGRITYVTWPERLRFAASLALGPDHTNPEAEPLGAHVVALAPLALVAVWRRPGEPRWIGGFTLFYLALWLAGGGPLITRALMPVLPGVALLIALGVDAVPRAAGGIAAGIALAFWIQLPVRPLSIALPYLTGRETREQYFTRAWGDVYRVHAAMDHLLAPGTPVLAIYSAESGLTHCRLVVSHDVEGAFAMATGPTKAAVERYAQRVPALVGPNVEPVDVLTREAALAELARRGIEHILVNEGLNLPLDHTLIPLIRGDLSLLARSGRVTLYRVRKAPDAPAQ